MKEIKPCPFCGDDDPWLHEWIFGARVICRNCRTEGPEHKDGHTVSANATGAWDKWNNRSSTVECDLRDMLKKSNS